MSYAIPKHLHFFHFPGLSITARALVAGACLVASALSLRRPATVVARTEEGGDIVGRNRPGSCGRHHGER